MERLEKYKTHANATTTANIHTNAAQTFLTRQAKWWVIQSKNRGDRVESSFS